MGPSLALVLAVLVAAKHPAASARLEARVVAQAPTFTRAVGELSLLLLERPERDMPLLVHLESESVQLLDRQLDWDEVVDDRAEQPRMRATFRAEPGTHKVRARIAYVVCGPKWCREKRGQAEWTFVVAAP